MCDDPHNIHDAESDVIRKGACDWWDKVMSTRLTGAKVIIMQRVHYADLAGHVLDQGGYEHLCLPAEYEGRLAGDKCLYVVGCVGASVVNKKWYALAFI